jgi:hypothetical protein
MSSETKPSEVPSSATVAEPVAENSQATREKAAGTIQVFQTPCTCLPHTRGLTILQENVSGA